MSAQGKGEIPEEVLRSAEVLFGIRRVTDPTRGPLDGVEMDTLGVYTKFRNKGTSRKIIHQEKAEIGIKASLSLGTVSFSDRGRNQQVTVDIMALTWILNEALMYGVDSDAQTVFESLQSEGGGEQ